VERLLRDVRADLQGLRRHLGDQRERLGL
jgi:hypothetical protein